MKKEVRKKVQKERGQDQKQIDGRNEGKGNLIRLALKFYYFEQER